MATLHERATALAEQLDDLRDDCVVGGAPDDVTNALFVAAAATWEAANTLEDTE